MTLNVMSGQIIKSLQGMYGKPKVAIIAEQSTQMIWCRVA